MGEKTEEDQPESNISKMSNILAEFLKILADKTKLEILFTLRRDEMTASDIIDLLGKNQSTISQHLNAMIQADILVDRRESRNKFYSVKFPEIFSILKSISGFILNKNKDEMEKMSVLNVLDTLL